MPITYRIAGLRLREVRERRGYTQQELAFALHVTPTLIRYWEKGHTTPTVAQIGQLARALEVKPAALWMVPGAPLQH
jgi:transcriptional regulator with XRE-family HTH domain